VLTKWHSKAAFVACLALGLALWLAACGNDGAEEESGVQDREVAVAQEYDFYIVGDDSYPPVSFIQDGQLRGISYDMVVEVFERLGYTVKIELFPWARCQAMVSDGIADGFFGAYKTEERLREYAYGDEYLIVESNVFFVPRESGLTYDGRVENLKEYTIGTYLGHATLEPYLEDGTLTHVDFSGNVEESLHKLASGNRNIDLLLNNDYVFWYTAEQMGMADDFKALPLPFSQHPTYFAFTRQRDMSQLIAQTDAQLHLMRQDGTYEEIVARYVPAGWQGQ